MKDATFEGLLERNASKKIHERNIPILVIEIHESLHHINEECFGSKNINKVSLSQ